MKDTGPFPTSIFYEVTFDNTLQSFLSQLCPVGRWWPQFYFSVKIIWVVIDSGTHVHCTATALLGIFIHLASLHSNKYIADPTLFYLVIVFPFNFFSFR